MMAIESLRFRSVQTTKLVALGGHEVFKGADEERVKDTAGKWAPQQVRGDFVLIFHQSSGTTRSRKPSGKVEMQAGIDSMFPGQASCPLRILHEYHGAHRGDGAPEDAL
jgi:hypothetical protein